MQYRARRAQIMRDHVMSQGRDPDGPIVWSGELGWPPSAEPRHGDEWGRWRYNAEALSLELEGDNHYEVDLARCTTAAEVLDWIVQVARKEWCDAGTVGELVQALDDLIHPQHHLCSGGITPIKDGAVVKFDVSKYLKSRTNRD